ncbi:hypothetical protein BDV93DRAFT_519224, partial [Ceratobasidium sp. AG-I]
LTTTTGQTTPGSDALALALATPVPSSKRSALVPVQTTSYNKQTRWLGIDRGQPPLSTSSSNINL